MTNQQPPEFHLIVAYDQNRGIGYQNQIPWYISNELKWFKKITMDKSDPNLDQPNCVIMGSHTWESIPEKFRPLPGRLNIVLSRSRTFTEAVTCSDLNSALQIAETKADRIFIIGGAMLYREALDHPYLKSIYATEVEGNFKVDRHFPEFKERFPHRTLLATFSQSEEQAIGFTCYHFTE